MTESSDSSDPCARPQDYAGLRAELAVYCPDIDLTIAYGMPESQHERSLSFAWSENFPNSEIREIDGGRGILPLVIDPRLVAGAGPRSEAVPVRRRRRSSPGPLASRARRCRRCPIALIRYQSRGLELAMIV